MGKEPTRGSGDVSAYANMALFGLWQMPSDVSALCAGPSALNLLMGEDAPLG